MSLLRKATSDPYVVVTLGAQQFKTRTINNELNPKWDYWCEVKFIHLAINIFRTLNYVHNYCVVRIVLATWTGVKAQTLR